MIQAPLTLRDHNPDVLSCIANLSNDEVFTPPEMADAMLDLVASAWADANNGESIWADPTVTFLDPFTKSGVFLREIVRRLTKGLATAIPDLEMRVDPGLEAVSDGGVEVFPPAKIGSYTPSPDEVEFSLAYVDCAVSQRFFVSAEAVVKHRRQALNQSLQSEAQEMMNKLIILDGDLSVFSDQDASKWDLGNQ